MWSHGCGCGTHTQIARQAAAPISACTSRPRKQLLHQLTLHRAVCSATSRGAPQQQPAAAGRAGEDDAGPAISQTLDRDQQHALKMQPLPNFAEVAAVAAERGLHLSLKTLGPGFRVVARDGDEGGRILGVTSGFLLTPLGLMHCDMLQIFTRGLGGEQGDRLRRGPLGLGLLLGAAVFAHGAACGCHTAEILAINDDDAWHERLVRYYSYFGFKPVCKVGGQGLRDVPHLLVWGGEGTRMDADVRATLTRWTPALRRSVRSSSSSSSSSGSSGNKEDT